MTKENFKILMLYLYSNNQLFIPHNQTIEDWIDNAFEQQTESEEEQDLIKVISEVSNYNFKRKI